MEKIVSALPLRMVTRFKPSDGAYVTVPAVKCSCFSFLTHPGSAVLGLYKPRFSLAGCSLFILPMARSSYRPGARQASHLGCEAEGSTDLGCGSCTCTTPLKCSQSFGLKAVSYRLSLQTHASASLMERQPPELSRVVVLMILVSLFPPMTIDKLLLINQGAFRASV